MQRYRKVCYRPGHERSTPSTTNCLPRGAAALLGTCPGRSARAARLAAQYALREVAGQQHAYPDGRPVQVSVRTLQRWRAAYASGNIEALVPRSRKRTENNRHHDHDDRHGPQPAGNVGKPTHRFATRAGDTRRTRT